MTASAPAPALPLLHAPALALAPVPVCAPPPAHVHTPAVATIATAFSLVPVFVATASTGGAIPTPGSAAVPAAALAILSAAALVSSAASPASVPALPTPVLTPASAISPAFAAGLVLIPRPGPALDLTSCSTPNSDPASRPILEASGPNTTPQCCRQPIFPSRSVSHNNHDGHPRKKIAIIVLHSERICPFIVVDSNRQNE